MTQDEHDSLQAALAEAGRQARASAAADFAAAAKDWADSLDGFDNQDRHHTREFALAWDRRIAERVAASPGPLPAAAGPDVGTRAAALADEIRRRHLIKRDAPAPADALLGFADREWLDTARLASAQVHAAWDEMARDNIHGTHRLHWLADAWASGAGQA